MRQFHSTAIGRGQTSVLTIIPTGLDLNYFEKHAVWPYQNLLDLAAEAKIDVVNFAEGIIKRLDGSDPFSLFVHCSRHCNEAGYALLGGIAFEEMDRCGPVPAKSNNETELWIGDWQRA